MENQKQDWDDMSGTEQVSLIFKKIFSYSGFLLGFIVLCMVGCPHYNVYQQQKEGEAELARATSNRQIKTQEALAVKQSASDLAAADTIRAHGVARANQIIGASLKDNPEYLKWLWIDGMEKNQNAVYYIPTETGIPLLEAGRSVHQPANAPSK